MKENDAKRERANAKITLERKLLNEKVKQIKSMTDEIVTLGETSSELHTLVSKNIGYKSFMTSVIDAGNGYGKLTNYHIPRYFRINDNFCFQMK